MIEFCFVFQKSKLENDVTGLQEKYEEEMKQVSIRVVLYCSNYKMDLKILRCSKSSMLFHCGENFHNCNASFKNTYHN